MIVETPAATSFKAWLALRPHHHGHSTKPVTQGYTMPKAPYQSCGKKDSILKE